MESISYTENTIPKREELVYLYNNVNWTIYTSNPTKLEKALEQSLYLLTAWEGDQLIGLLRAVGDGLTIIYIQDILVLECHQRRGIGKELLSQTLEKYKTVRQKVLLTDDTVKTRAFYSSLGFTPCDDGQLIAFARVD